MRPIEGRNRSFPRISLVAVCPRNELPQSSRSHESQGSHAQADQHHPQVRGDVERDPEAGRERHIGRHTDGALGDERQRNTRKDPAGDFPATAQASHGLTSVIASPSFDPTAAVRVHGFDFAEAQPQVADAGDAVSGQ
jgi:hypothetical protein